MSSTIRQHPRRSQAWLFVSLATREISNRYVGSLGGLWWALIHPLVLLTTYGLLFGSILKARLPELQDQPFFAFVAIGLWPWLAFQEGVLRGAQAIRVNAALVRKVAFAHELLVVAAVTSTFGVHSIGFILALVVMTAFGINIFATGLPVLVIVLILLFCLAVACALLLAALQVFIPDVEQLLGPTLSILFYITPILYPSSVAPDWLQHLTQLNPLAHFLEPLRQALLFDQILVSRLTVFVWVGVPLLALPVLWLFRRLSPFFEDFL